jgi:hypothetical protein
MTAAAFEATFSDFKIIRGRKVAQVVLEVPLEAADTALRVLGGVPRPDAECWVAVARLQRSGAQAHEPGNAPPAGGTEGRSRPERVPFREKPASVRAALMCRDFTFQTWVGEQKRQPGQSETDCANWLRDKCGVFSRATFDTDRDARARFELLENQFLADTGRVAAPERR